jgi:peptide deformylase
MRAALFSYKSEGFTGVAIAAPQIGIPLRIFLVEDTAPDKDGTRILPTLVAINPEIVKLSKRKRNMHEGCLSVRNKYGTVERAERATIRAYDEHGTLYERGGGGLLAQIFQHECDHLDGTLFVDKATKIVDKGSEKSVVKK